MKRFTKGVVSLIGLMFFAFLLSTAFVEDAKETKTDKPSTNASAMKAGKNNDGSLRRTTNAEDKKLDAELQKTLSKYPKHTAKKKDDGSLALVVAPHSMNASVAHKGPDGKLHLNCSDAAAHTATKAQTTEELSEE